MRTKIVELRTAEQAELEAGYKEGGSAAFRKRCHVLLLKGQGRSSKEVGEILGLNQMAVGGWIKRYEEEGIEGLKTRAGRGRKPILDKERDAEQVKAVVMKERQRLKLAKAELEELLGKCFSVDTLKRFLKNSSAVGSV